MVLISVSVHVHVETLSLPLDFAVLGDGRDLLEGTIEVLHLRSENILALQII